MAERWIKLELPQDIDKEQYARLAHAVWSVAKVAIEDGDFRVEHDGRQTNKSLNAVWSQDGADYPWGSA